MTVNGRTLAQMLLSAACCLNNRRDEINNLNVFPVPDGDTGINMALTMKPLSAIDSTLPICRVAQDAASITLRSARGNSGAILSLFFRGFAKALADKEEAEPSDIARAFMLGSEEAYRAVMSPTEGTILTVMRLTAEEAPEIAKRTEESLALFFTSIEDVARRALARTPEMLPILRQAHVVDAGGAGFVAVLEGMAAAAKGTPFTSEELSEQTSTGASFEEFDTEDIRFAYCTECIVEKSDGYLGDEMAAAFRDDIAKIGDSMVFIEDESIIKVHIHSNDPGYVLSRAVQYGALVSVKVENMRKQHTSLTADSAPNRKYGFVAVAVGDGIAEAFRELGCDKIVKGGQSMNPSTDDILVAIEGVHSECVFVLPNNKNIFMVAKEAASLAEGKQVIVIETRNISEGMAALLNFDPESTLDANCEVMEEAIAHVTGYSVTHAARDSEIDGREIRCGQYLGLMKGKIISVSDTLSQALTEMASSMQSASFLTVFHGEDATEEDIETLTSVLTECVPDAELAVSYGGQPLYDFIISAE